MTVNALPPVHEPLTRSLGMAGPYRLAMEIASGGMGVVYLAFRELGGFRNVVAVKRIHAHLSRDAAFIDLFFDEAQIEARINHPYVCRVFDFGRDEQGHYIAMEFLRGEPLSRIFQALTPAHLGSPRHASTVLRVIANCAEGLHAAHTLKDIAGKPLNVVHRDVTPQNLFVLCDGTVRVTDFGVARARAQKHTTDSSTLKGKLDYVSPEQLKHEPLDLRTDIWSLGVVAWELLTGRSLFGGKSEGESVVAVLKQPILPPSYFQSAIPAEVDAIVLRALARDPAERYPDARSMARDIELILRGSALNMDVAEWFEALIPGVTERAQNVVQRAQAWVAAVDRQAAAAHGRAALSMKRRSQVDRRRVAALAALALFGLCDLGLFEETRHAHAVSAPLAAEPTASGIQRARPASPSAIRDSSSQAQSEPAVARFSRDGEYRVRPEPFAMSLAHPSDPSALLESGSVRLETSNGRAEVLLGDALVGVTPLTIDLPPGEHALQLRPLAGGALRVVNVLVTRGAEGLVHVVLPQAGAIVTEPEPSSASAP